MSVRLRLRRTGTIKKPSYRVVATDQRNPRDGRFIEVIGYYDPRRNQEGLDLERADYWIANGAQPSQTVAGIIRRARDGKLMTPPQKPAPKVEAPKVEAPAAAPAVAAEPAAEETKSE